MQERARRRRLAEPAEIGVGGPWGSRRQPYAGKGLLSTERPGPDPDPKTNYKVTAPPIGASVKDLPKSAKETTVDDKKYYTYQDAYYKPFYSGSDVVYMVVAKPS